MREAGGDFDALNLGAVVSFEKACEFTARHGAIALLGGMLLSVEPQGSASSSLFCMPLYDLLLREPLLATPLQFFNALFEKLDFFVSVLIQ